MVIRASTRFAKRSACPKADEQQEATRSGRWARVTRRQLTRGGELRAFFGGPGEIVYISPKPNDVVVPEMTAASGLAVQLM